MNLNQLEYFVSAAELLNFTRAAKHCFISQTAMTQQIRALEESIGVPLFLRDKHHVELTAAGEVYLREARQILERSQEARRLARLAASGDEGEITIGYITGFGISDGALLLKGFHHAFPNIKIKLIRDTMSGLMAALTRGECDLAISLTSAQFQNQYQDLEHKYLKSYPLMAVVSAEHPLARQQLVTYQELQQEKFIIMQPSARSRNEMEEILLIYDRGGFIPEIVAFDQEPETILLMVASGMGICLMPEYLVRHYRKSPDLRILSVVRKDGSTDNLDVELVWSREHHNPAVEKFLYWREES